MILSNGVDIVYIPRVVKIYNRFGEKFLRKILNILEIEEFYTFLKHNDRILYISKRFAAKEAFSKALGTGFTDGLRLNEIVTYKNQNGKPMIKFFGKTHKVILEKYSGAFFDLSISSDQDYAIAHVLMYCI